MSRPKTAPFPRFSNLLEALLREQPAPTSATSPTVLAFERTLECDGDRMRLRDPDGRVELDIRLTPDGPTVQLRAAALELEATRSIELRCDTFAVAARSHAAICCERGDVLVEAGDDVVLLGERILLN